MKADVLKKEACIRALAEAGGATLWVSAPAVEKRARELNLDLNRVTIRNILSRMREVVEYRTADGVRRFRLRGSNIPVTSAGPNAGLFVKPGTPWSSKRELASFLEKHGSGSLLIVDPYVSEETLDILAQVKIPIEILTCQVGRKGSEAAFGRAFRNFAKEHGAVQLRTCARDALHGRYIFTGGKGWVVDHSLQDLGKKPALVMPLHLDTVFADVYKHFHDLFTNAVNF